MLKKKSTSLKFSEMKMKFGVQQRVPLHYSSCEHASYIEFVLIAYKLWYIDSTKNRVPKIAN